MTEATLTINHGAGLHLRPAALFVQTAAKYQASVRVRNLSRANSPEADAKSMFGVMQIGVAQGHEILVRADGDDEQEAIDALRQLVDGNFGEAP
jgi:phosphotransferase system HPr (HPr) family protein